jgi:magnesium-protoporphyrin IX monomethyl ester (oxidative) cyclase
MASVSRVAPACTARVAAVRPRAAKVVARAAAGSKNLKDDQGLGFDMMRKGVKVAAEDTLLTPRFYTTDFDEMDRLFSQEINPNLRMDEIDAMLEEFRNDYNQTHFVRNQGFKEAADRIQGRTRKIFIEFLERSCTAEFSGFLLYKELGRRLKKTNPAVAEIFTLLSRDEARHAGFINKAMSDFGLALDLGFLTKNRAYTFFQPKYIIYATYLSEKIGYWRYVSIYRHLQRNPDDQLYPMFEYFENWCQDESRHGDFLAAMLKARPELINGPVAKWWCRFFCLSVYATMYLNDHQRDEFYRSIGLNTTEFNQHVIIETNRTTARIFPAVTDVEHPEFFPRLDKCVVANNELVKLGSGASIVSKLPHIWTIFTNILAIFLSKPIEQGAVDMTGEEASMVF